MTKVKRFLMLSVLVTLIGCSENIPVSKPAPEEVIESPSNWVHGELKLGNDVLNLEFPRGSRLSELDSIGIIEMTSGEMLAIGKHVPANQLKQYLDSDLSIESLTIKGYRVVVTEGFKDSIRMVFKNVPL